MLILIMINNQVMIHHQSMVSPSPLWLQSSGGCFCAFGELQMQVRVGRAELFISKRTGATAPVMRWGWLWLVWISDCGLLHKELWISAMWLHHPTTSRSRHQFCSIWEKQMLKRCGFPTAYLLVCLYLTAYISVQQLSFLSSLATFSELIKCKQSFWWCYRKCIANELYHERVSHYQH